MTRSSPARPAHRAVIVRRTVLASVMLAGLASPAWPPAHAAPRPKICLVLSGGGARGIAHIGVLKVLEQQRVPIDCVVGTSAGAVIGGAYASGASPEEIERAIRGADWDDLLTDQPARFNRSVYAKEVDRARFGSREVGIRSSSIGLPRGVVIGQHLQFFLQTLVAPAGRGPFDELPIPYRALATDFTTGRLAVLDHGDLAGAIRASMSVPGAFAPVDIEGRTLVDGGLVRNLGVDVARQLGADIIIAVNVGAPLLKREELGSLLSAAEQTLFILVQQNVDVSLASLGVRDVLISPDLGALGVGDFAHGADFIPAGELATRLAAPALAPLALSEADYAAWRRTQRRARVAPHYDHVVVDTSRLVRVPPASISRLLGGDPDPANPDAAINTLLGTDDFELIEGEVHPEPDGTTLVLRPVEKPWGPDYLRVGGLLTANFEGTSTFTLYLDQRRTWLNDSGLEWRNRGSLGQIDSLASELRQPLDSARTVFVAPRLFGSNELHDLYVGSDSIGSFRVKQLRIGLDLGLRIGNLGEVTAGIEGGSGAAARTTGEALGPDVRHRIGALYATWVFDRLDSLDFPRRGFLLTGDAELARRMLGGEDVYDRVSIDAQQAFGTERSSLLIEARYQTALGGQLPLYEQFTLGGFQNLSGLALDQELSSRIAFLRTVYRWRVATFSALLPALYAGVSLEAADLGARPGGVRPGQLYGGSTFLSADSALGPLYLGIGVADGGFTALYLYVGRP
ncbi:MAG TPA: patatin-like phospholipase family protein [Steroidobacteraceae bacterium]|nr:patatin-like phospholipase family protein [Steroidobacteraceae bacterium]